MQYVQYGLHKLFSNGSWKCLHLQIQQQTEEDQCWLFAAANFLRLHSLLVPPSQDPLLNGSHQNTYKNIKPSSA